MSFFKSLFQKVFSTILLVFVFSVQAEEYYNRFVRSLIDTIPPVLHSIEVTPSIINDGGILTVSIHATDDLSGIESLFLFDIISPNGSNFLNDIQTGFSFNEQTQRYVRTYEIPATMVSGTWKVGRVNIRDKSGNEKTYSRSEMESTFEVQSSISDTTPPILHSIEVTPSIINDGGILTVSIHATDDLSGIESLFLFDIISPNGSNFLNDIQTGFSFNEQTQRYVRTYEIPPTVTTGGWKVGKVNIRDKSGNEKTYSRSEMEANFQVGSDFNQAAPTAIFTASPTQGETPLTVDLDASQSTDSDGNIVSWQWETSTGQSIFGQTTSLTFTPVGTHIITLTVTDDYGTPATAQKTVTVTESQNQAPTAAFTLSSSSGQTPLTVDVDASQSIDSDGNIVSYEWTTSTGQSTSGETVSLIFTAVGTHTITLAVTDDRGTIATIQQTVTVTDIQENHSLTITPDSITLRPKEPTIFTASGGSPEYIWTPESGQLSATKGKQVTYIAPDIIGNYTITLTDGTGNIINADIEVIDTLDITPKLVSVVLGNTESISFTALGGASPYTWKLSEGQNNNQLQVSSDTASVQYIPPTESGEYSVMAIDSKGDVVTAFIRVVAVPKISPNYKQIATQDVAQFQVTGGVAPYTWNTALGDLSNKTGSRTTYLTPQLMGIDTITVSDALGNESRAEVEITGNLQCSPLKTVAFVGETVKLTALKGTGEYTWEDGSTESDWEGRFNQTGRQEIIVTDSVNDSCLMIVEVVREGLNIFHPKSTVALGDVINFSVIGGANPYTWNFEAGSLSSTKGQRVGYVAPDVAGIYTITVIDSKGTRGEAEVTVVSQEIGIISTNLIGDIFINELPIVETNEIGNFDSTGLNTSTGEAQFRGAFTSSDHILKTSGIIDNNESIAIVGNISVAPQHINESLNVLVVGELVGAGQYNGYYAVQESPFHIDTWTDGQPDSIPAFRAIGSATEQIPVNMYEGTLPFAGAHLKVFFGYRVNSGEDIDTVFFNLHNPIDIDIQ